MSINYSGSRSTLSRRNRPYRIRLLAKVAVVCAVVGLLGWIVFGHEWGWRMVSSTESTGAGDPQMLELISRLKHANLRTVRVADMVFRSYPVDKTVRDEIQAKGRRAVPYLIQGLRDEDDYVRNECADLLSSFPSKVVVKALIDTLRGDSCGPIPDFFALQASLYSLTGHSTWFGPSWLPTERERLAGMRELWFSWWEENKDALVDTKDGIGLRRADGSIRPLGRQETERSKPDAEHPED